MVTRGLRDTNRASIMRQVPDAVGQATPGIPEVPCGACRAGCGDSFRCRVGVNDTSTFSTITNRETSEACKRRSFQR